MPTTEMARVASSDVQGGYMVGPRRKKRELFASWLVPQEDMFSLTARPVFQVGNWKGREYTKADLAGVVEAFDATLNQLKPRVKLGHDESQAFARSASPGTPSFGFVSDVYLNDEYTDRATGKKVAAGTQLLADFVNIPRSLYEPLRRLAYPERSVELLVDYPDAERPGKTWPLALKNVAFLGDELPGVRGLPPLVEMFDEPVLPTTILTFQGEYPMPIPDGMPAAAVPAGDIAELKSMLAEVIGLLKAKADEPEEELADKPKQEPDKEKMADPKAPAVEAPAVPTTPAAPVAQVVSNAETEKRFAALEAEAKAAKAEAAAAKLAVTTIQQAREDDKRTVEFSEFIESLSTEKNNRLPAAEKGRALYLLQHAPNGETLKFSEGAGKPEQGYLDALKGFMSNLPDRSALFGVKTKHFSQPSAPSAQTLADKAKALEKEKGISFADALTTIIAEQGGEQFYTQAVHGDA